MEGEATKAGMRPAFLNLVRVTRLMPRMAAIWAVLTSSVCMGGEDSALITNVNNCVFAGFWKKMCRNALILVAFHNRGAIVGGMRKIIREPRRTVCISLAAKTIDGIKAMAWENNLPFSRQIDLILIEAMENHGPQPAQDNQKLRDALEYDHTHTR